MKNILVTGGTSYIGKHVIAQLIEKDYSVRTTLRDKSKVEEIKNDIEKHLNKQISLDVHIADLLNDDGWKENMSRIAEAHPGSPLASRYGKDSTKNINTRNVLKKHKVL